MNCFPTQTLAVVLAILLATTSSAGDRCAQCGCNGCEQVCRLVREDKKVSITCWGCKCEDFCAPGKSCLESQHCEGVCNECEPQVCTVPKTFVRHNWIPGCAGHVYTKKKLMKRIVVKTVPATNG